MRKKEGGGVHKSALQPMVAPPAPAQPTNTPTSAASKLPYTDSLTRKSK